MGGKTSTSTQSVSIPPEVLARYNAVNARAENVATQPFQQYGTDASAFVAPLSSTQQAGIANTNAAAGAAQPYFGAATTMAMQGSQGTNVGPLTGQDISRYANPFVESVVQPTARLLNQQQQQQQSGQTGNAIRSGAFGGDRAGIAAANLAGQQSLAFANAINPLYSQAYQQGLGTAQQQQGFGLQQQQANLARLQQGAQTVAGLGTGAQTAALQGAAAQLQAGQQQQQTEQAGRQALYNQFLQQQGYPFQVAQFLANIAMGTGALSGSTTSTTQQQPFFSDRRLKYDIRRVGHTDDGLPIYKFKYKGDPKEQTHIGLMAQDVEKEKPEAVGLSGGYKTVDYDRATRAHGGLVTSSEGGGVWPEMAGEGFADGGMPQLDIFSGQGRIPASVLAQIQNAPRRQIMLPSMGLKAPSSVFADAMADAQKAMASGKMLGEIYQAGKEAKNFISPSTQASGGVRPSQSATSTLNAMSDPQGSAYDWLKRASGGSVDPYDPEEKRPDFMSSVLREGKVDTQSLPKPGQLPSQKSGMEQLAGGIGALKTLYDVGSSAAEFLPMLFLKDGGGVMPRHGYATRGEVDPDLPAEGAAEAAGRLSDMSPEELAIRTIAAETSGDPRETAAIAHVINNRLKSGKWGKSLSDVVLSPGQFEPWSNPEGANYPGKIDPESRRYKISQAAFQGLGAAEDPTGGATHFYAPAAQEALGRKPPPWDKGDGLDIGKTRFFKNVDAGGVRPSQNVSVEPPSSRMDEIANKYLSAPGKNTETGGVGGLLTSEKFWVPVLTGLGTMAASPSRYLGSAILQGLGGGAQAYANLEKQQMEQQRELAGIGQTKAATEQTGAQTQGIQIENYMRSFKDTPYGRVVFLATGVPILASEYERRWKAGERLPLLGSVPPDAEARAAAVFGAKQPGSTMGAPAAPTAPVAPTAPKPQAAAPATPTEDDHTPKPFEAAKPQAAPVGVNYGDASKSSAKSEGEGAISAGPAFELAKKQTDIYNALVTSDANTARQNSPYLNQLATTLSNAYKGGGFDTPGYAAEVRSEIVRAANTLSRAIGGSNISDLDSDSDIVNKISTLLGSQGAAAGNQESYAALNAIRNAIPNLRMNPDAGARLTAELMQMKQRAIDRAAHAALYARDSGGLLGQAATSFRDENPDGKYEMEAAIIEDLIKHRPDQLRQMMSGTVSQKHIDEAIRKWYGNGSPAGMYRYFASRPQ